MVIVNGDSFMICELLIDQDYWSGYDWINVVGLCEDFEGN